jgi:cyclopropane-fatty-acyl-phospholipid synthase
MGAWPQSAIVRALASADIAVNGNRPWDVRIHNPRLFRRVLLSGTIGLGDAYVDGWWDCDALDQLFDRALRADLPSQLRLCPATLAAFLTQKLVNLQTLSRIVPRVRAHYDMDTDVFAATLDRRLLYTCGYWETAHDLDQAQEDKLELICRKLGLRPGMRLLDIGCGWGGLCRYAAERFGCSVVGITLSPVQAEYARNHCRGQDVEIRIQDYRRLTDRFDRITVVGMLEHVGQKNHRAFMRVLRGTLTDDGLALLHFFAAQRSWPNTRDSEVLWIMKHIFRGMVIPSLAQIGAAADGLFVLEDLHNFGAHYEPTLMAWHANFARHWPSLRAKYGERFYRLWTYYLLSAAGAFRARKYQLWQLVLSPHGVPGGYRSIRSVAPDVEPSEVVVRPRPIPVS